MKHLLELRGSNTEIKNRAVAVHLGSDGWIGDDLNAKFLGQSFDAGKVAQILPH